MSKKYPLPSPLLLLLPLLAVLGGCPVTQDQQTPVEPTVLRAGEHKYWLYVPSTYTPDREWPMVVTLHGTFGFDDGGAQIREWKRLAEDNGLIVAAPALKSVQGILPVIKSMWHRDLETDERAVLAVMDDVQANYRIGTYTTNPKPRRGLPTTRPAVLLSGFSAGGYPMYYIGLRNPERFGMILGRSCNSDVDLFDSLEPTLSPQARQLPIYMFWGRDETAMARHNWNAIAWLSRHGFKNTDWKTIPGGHWRHPEVAYNVWKNELPAAMIP